MGIHSQRQASRTSLRELVAKLARRGRRHEPTASDVKTALANRGYVRCLNGQGELLHDEEDVSLRGPVARLSLTIRGRKLL